jgi:SAM-dependent methyltransferase
MPDPLTRVAEKPRCRLWRPSALLPSGKPGKALDVGCGSGRNSVELASRGWKVTALDVLPDAIEMARSLELRYGVHSNPLEFKNIDFHDCQTEERFDLICMIRTYRPDFVPIARGLMAAGALLVMECFSANRKRNAATLAEVQTLCEGLTILKATDDQGMCQVVARQP